MTDNNTDQAASADAAHQKDVPNETLSKRFPQATRALLALGVTSIVVRYSAENAIGGIDVVEIHGAQCKRFADGTVPHDVFVETLKFFSELLHRRHPKWCGRTGSFGVFEWEVRSGRLRHFHHQRFIDVTTQLHEGI